MPLVSRILATLYLTLFVVLSSENNKAWAKILCNATTTWLLNCKHYSFQQMRYYVFRMICIWVGPELLWYERQKGLLHLRSFTKRRWCDFDALNTISNILSCCSPLLNKLYVCTVQSGSTYASFEDASPSGTVVFRSQHDDSDSPRTPKSRLGLQDRNSSASFEDSAANLAEVLFLLCFAHRFKGGI